MKTKFTAVDLGDYYELKFGDDVKPLKVSKQGLHPNTSARIRKSLAGTPAPMSTRVRPMGKLRALGPPKAFADGGTVPELDDVGVLNKMLEDEYAADMAQKSAQADYVFDNNTPKDTGLQDLIDQASKRVGQIGDVLPDVPAPEMAQIGGFDTLPPNQITPISFRNPVKDMAGKVQSEQLANTLNANVQNRLGQLPVANFSQLPPDNVSMPAMMNPAQDEAARAQTQALPGQVAQATGDTIKRLEAEKAAKEAESIRQGNAVADELTAAVGLPPVASQAGAPSAQSAGVGQPVSAPAAVPPPAPKETAVYDKALADREAAIKLAAGLEEKQAKDINDFVDRSTKLQQEAFERYNTAKRELDLRKEELRKDILNGKEDPNRLWGSMDTGRKILAAASLLLGGVAVGASGLRIENGAYQVLDKAIQRDIEAQRQNLGRKKSILADYRKAGLDLDSAFKMTSAFYKDLAATQLEAVKGRYTGQAAQAKADALIAQLRMEAEKDRDKIITDRINAQYAPELAKLDIAKRNKELAVQDARIRLLDAQRRKATRTPGLSSKQAEEINKIQRENIERQITQKVRSGEPISFEDKSLIADKTVLDTLVYNPRIGGFVAAQSADAAKKLNEKAAASADVLSALDELEEIRARHPRGLYGPVFTEEARKDKARAEFIEGTLPQLITTAIGGGAAQEGERQAAMEFMPRVTTWDPLTGASRFQSKVAGLRGIVDKSQQKAWDTFAPAKVEYRTKDEEAVNKAAELKNKYGVK